MLHSTQKLSLKSKIYLHFYERDGMDLMTTWSCDREVKCNEEK